jgi:hypothetical protein
VILHSDPQESYFTVGPQEEYKFSTLGNPQELTEHPGAPLSSDFVRATLHTQALIIDFVSATYWKKQKRASIHTNHCIFKPSIHTKKRYSRALFHIKTLILKLIL